MSDDLDVSVIVALYNTGDALRRLINSLDAQTLPASRFEVVLVDDGSTDDTLQIARELAATRPQVVVETIPNSGWPGRPRNVGIVLARGRYVFFADHDDAFGPRALEAMHETAERTGADIVYGKVVRIGRVTPYWPVWAEDVDDADLLGPVLSSRTTHKLYRTAFLAEHDLRFREGRIRLEDHDFMAHALPLAKVISVLASVPCYFWIHRTDGTNASDAKTPVARYWGHYGEVLGVWEDVAGPGPLLDAARAEAARQMFSRLSARNYLARSSSSRANGFAALHEVVARHLPPELDQRLGVLKRLRVQALRDGERARFEALQEARADIGFTLSTDRVALRDGHLWVAVTAACQHADGTPVCPERSGNEVLLPLGDVVRASVETRTLSEAELGSLEITVRNRGTGVEWPVADQRCWRESSALVVRAEATVDLTRDAFGAVLQTGSWDVVARIQFLGEALARTVRAVRVEDTKRQLPDGVELVAGGTLTFAVGRRTDQRPDARSLQWAGRELSMTVDNAVAAVLVNDRGSTATPQRAAVISGVATLPLDGANDQGRRLLDVWAEDISGETVRLGYIGRELTCPTPGEPRLAAYSTAHGSLSIEVAGEPEAIAFKHRPRGGAAAAVAGVAHRLRRWRRA